MATNKISPSKKDIYTKLLDIAEKYTDISNEDFLKSGLFGYVLESSAMMMRDSTIQKDMLYNESFLNTAMIPKSIYNWAKMFNIEVSKATPAYANIDIIIPKNSIITKKGSYYSSYNYGSDINSGSDYFILDKGDPIIAGDYYFTLEHSIAIESTTSNVYTAKYIKTEKVTTSYQTLSSYILPVENTADNIIIHARAYQYRVTKVQKQIVSDSFLNTKIHTFDFDDQFAGAQLYYNKINNNPEEVTLRYSNIASSTTTKFAYYSLVNTNQLQISFNNTDGGFIPAQNSTLTLYLYTTKGTSVPANYTADAYIKISNEDFKAIPIVVQFNPTTILGGSDAPSLSKIKQTIINEISTRNTIVTESDINNYFQILTQLLETINDGKVTFIKKRDDILKRTFAAYVLLRDGLDDSTKATNTVSDSTFVSSCIPTNTIDVTFNVSNNISKSFGTYITRDSSQSEIKYIESSTISDNTDDSYIVPFYMYINLDPIKKVKYMYNLADNKTTFSYISTKNDNLTMTPSEVRVSRSISSANTAEDSYNFEFTFSTDEDFSTLSGGTIKFDIVNPSTESAYGTSISKDATKSDYVKSTKDETTGTYTTVITIPIKVATNEFSFDTSSSANLGTFINLTLGSDSIMNIPEDIKVKLTLSGITSGTSKTIESAVFESDSTLNLFKNLDDIMSSDITINSGTYYVYNGIAYTTEDAATAAKAADTTNTSLTVDETQLISSITVKDVPVVKYNYFSSTNSKNKFISELFTYIDMLKENLSKLETSTFFDLKFYNTCGYSQYYTNTIRTNITLKLLITLKSEYQATNYSNSDNLKQEIRSYIRRLVDNMNNNNKINYSSIVGMLQQDATYGSYIDNIQFVGMNGTFYQNLEKNTSISDVLYTPEWINILASDLTSNNIKFSDDSN